MVKICQKVASLRQVRHEEAIEVPQGSRVRGSFSLGNSKDEYVCAVAAGGIVCGKDTQLPDVL